MQPEHDEILAALLRSGKEQFLAHGFDRASLRVICRNANVTTGAFYSHFAHKEDLFCAIVEPTISALKSMSEHVAAQENYTPDNNLKNELASVAFARAHRDEIRLLFECSAGTRYADFREQILRDYFCPTYRRVLELASHTQVDPDLLRILLHMKMVEYKELIFGDFSPEKIEALVTSLNVFSSDILQHLTDC